MKMEKCHRTTNSGRVSKSDRPGVWYGAARSGSGPHAGDGPAFAARMERRSAVPVVLRDDPGDAGTDDGSRLCLLASA